MDPEVRDAIAGHAPRHRGRKIRGRRPLGVKWVEIIERAAASNIVGICVNRIGTVHIKTSLQALVARGSVAFGPFRSTTCAIFIGCVMDEVMSGGMVPGAERTRSRLQCLRPGRRSI